MGAQLKIVGATPKSLKEQMREAAYAAIDRLVDELPNKIDGEDLESISDATGEAMRPVSAAVFKQGLLSRGQSELVARSCACPKCGATLKNPKMASRKIDTMHGAVEIERPYFYCRSCCAGFCPFDSKVGLASAAKQFDLQKRAAELMAEVPFETASRLFEKLTGQSISDHCLHEIGERLAEASDIVDVLPTAKKINEIIAEHANDSGWRPMLAVAADGAHLPTRPKEAGRAEKRGAGEWREAKGFRIYMVGKERIEQIMSWHQIANEEEFGESLAFAATLIPQDKVRIALLGDGAPWLWKHMTKSFPTGKEVLDYYHCSEHVHKLAEIQYEKDPDAQASWIESTMVRLHAGEVGAVVWGLERMNPASDLAADEIRKLVGYLENNAHRIDYDAAKRGGYPRGSGGIESANKFICHVRMKRSGAWWYTINGNAMLRLRCSIYNATFDEVFAKYKKFN
jgi:hypothetical protein